MTKYIPSYKQAAASVAFLTIIFTAGLTDGLECLSLQGDKESQKNQSEQILTSIEKADFQLWSQQVGKDFVVASNISQNDFNEFVQVRQAARSGYYDKSVELATNLKVRLLKKITSGNG
ncbi:MAG: hypothetical protein WCG01_04390 [bacterium]